MRSMAPSRVYQTKEPTSAIFSRLPARLAMASIEKSRLIPFMGETLERSIASFFGLRASCVCASPGISVDRRAIIMIGMTPAITKLPR